MKNSFKLSLYLNYFVFAILLNNIDRVILKLGNFYHVSRFDVNTLEFFKYISIGLIAFFLASFLPRIGYKRAILIRIIAICLGCIGILGVYFWIPEVLFTIMGTSFALIKLSMYSSIGRVNNNKNHHRFMSYIKGVFILATGTYFLFPSFNRQENSTSLLKMYLLLTGICMLPFIFLNKTKEVVLKNTSSLKENFFSMFYLIKSPLVIIFALSAILFAMIKQSKITWIPVVFKKMFFLSDEKPIMSYIIFYTFIIGLGKIIEAYFLRFFSWSKRTRFYILIVLSLAFFSLCTLFRYSNDMAIWFFLLNISYVTTTFLALFLSLYILNRKFKSMEKKWNEYA